jgi:cAMP-dependent protein kinase regulator
MSLPSAYLQEIESLNKEILQAQPADVLQYCATYFQKRLETERAQFLLSAASSQDTVMSGSTFPGRLGTNANPFGGEGISPSDQSGSGLISKVMEEDENDAVTSPTTPNLGFGKGGAPVFGGAFGGDGAGGPPSSFKPSNPEGFPAHYGMGRRTSVSAESMNPTASSNDNWAPPFHPKSADQLTRLKKSIANNFLFSHLDNEQSSQVLGALVEKPIPAKGIKVRPVPAAYRVYMG